MDNGQGCIQFFQRIDTLFRKKIDGFGNCFEFVCGVLLLPALGILPAIGFLNIQIAEQQRGEVGGFRLRRLGAQALLCLEHIKQPFFQLADLRLDVTEQTICRFDTAVQFAALGSDAFLLHL